MHYYSTNVYISNVMIYHDEPQSSAQLERCPDLIVSAFNWFATISYRMSIEFPLNLSADRQSLGLTSRSAYHVAASNGTS